MAIFSLMIFPRRSPRTIFAICLLISLGIELAQVRIPGRVSDPIDVFTNSAGVVCASIWAKKHVKNELLRKRKFLTPTYSL